MLTGSTPKVPFRLKFSEIVTFYDLTFSFQIVDHSKWAVSVPSKGKQALTCVSDLNRMRSQFSRGGGSICLQSPSMWSIFNATVENIEPCPRNKKPK